MIFKACKLIGEFQIERLDGSTVKYTVKPFDADRMDEVNALPKVEGKEGIFQQIRLFCEEFDESDFKGIPINTLTDMLEYVIQVSQGKTRTEAEKKTESKGPIKS